MNNAAALPPEVMDAFTFSAVTALRELMQIEATDADPSGIPAATEEDCIVATMVLQRPIPGRLTLLLTPATARHLAAAYLPAGTELTDDIIGDVASELTNVIAGQAKTILKDTPYHYSLSIPAVSRYAQQGGLVARTIVIATNLGLLMLSIEYSTIPTS